MAEAFDPYVKWLAIRDPARPPHHYRLLGLDPFESDPYVIACAADRQTAHVRKFLTGRHPQLCRRLLRELIRARRCLLNPEEKSAYDTRLHKKLDKQASANGRPVPPVATVASAFRAAEPPPVAAKPESTAHRSAPSHDPAPAGVVSASDVHEPVPIVDVRAVRSMARHMAQSRTRRTRQRYVSLLVAAVCLVVLFALAALAARRFELPLMMATDWLTPGADRTPPVDSALSEPTNQTDRINQADQTNRRSATTPRTDDPVVPKTDEQAIQQTAEITAVSTEERAANLGVNPAGRGYTAAPVHRTTTVEKTLHGQVEAADETATRAATKAVAAKPVTSNVVKTAQPPSRATERSKTGTRKSPRRKPLPDKAAQQQALVRIKSVYAEQFDKLDTDARREDLARFLLQKALETRNDDAARLVMLCQARLAANKAGNWPLVLQAVTLRGRWFDVDTLADEADVFEEICRAGNEQDVLRICQPLDGLFRQAVARNRFELAKRCAKTGQKAARRVGDAAAVHRAGERLRTELPEYVARKKSAQSAEKLLRDKPDDAVAHRLVGEYQCYNRGRWSQGLPHLARGDDEDLKRIAALELARPTEAAQQKAVADDWWTLSDERRGSEKLIMRERAGLWLRKALPGLTGLARDDAVQKIAELDAASRPTTQPKKVPPPQQWVDVLQQIDLAAQTVAAGWQMEGKRLRVLKAGRRSRLMLPVAPTASYELEIDFTSPFDSGETLALWLPTGSTACVLYVGPSYSGIGAIDGRPAKDNETTLRYASFPASESYKLGVKVTTKGKYVQIETLLNGDPFLGWRGLQTSLSGEADWQFPSRQNVGLGSWSGGVVVRTFRFRPVE